MCGIVGIHGPQDPSWIGAMNRSIAHRGPDDDGVFVDRAVELSLAMRRLAILDAAGGMQPMRSPDGRYVIVYNGEIYNSPELRAELEGAGERFATDHSDTEVLLRLLCRDGEACLNRLNGMFAFAFYDSVKRTLLCARDRMGIKPFYYTAGSRRFAFASELKALIELPFVSRDIDRQALFDYLSLLYVPEEQSILSSVKRLPAGHLLTYSLDTGKLDVRRWWQMRYTPDHGVREADWPEMVRETLRAATRRWTLSDVPIAVSLSGGLDSSAIAGIAAQSGLSVSAYSLGFSGEGEEAWNELSLARDVARKWGIPHHELVLRPEVTLDALPQMVEALDEPYGGGLPSWFVFAQMAGKVKVALTGTGGDELFGNYGKWLPLEGGPLTRLLSRDNRPIDQASFRREFFERYYYFPDAGKRAVLADGGDGCRDTVDMLYQRFADGSSSTTRDRVAGLDIGTQLPEEFLFMTDRFSMAHSIEARTPFLDNELVDLVSRIPAGIRTRRNGLKYLLRKAVAPLLPESLLTAPKRGFTIPFGKWLRGPLRPMVEDLLAPDRLTRQGFFSRSFYDNYVMPHLGGRADHTHRIWAAIMFQLWHQRFVEAPLSGAARSAVS
ncbi:asparagine synthase (glutamine-hydrolyzing) [Undibacter mobilis]|uniref:asparagine synthase (glutamine-hydrolyzing) n=1 Tax=Undibacter mobilis TaxID=2292256 RepID=A0A371B6K2_9BRAD|nr:asparagine synthase (glutamine-hydrolyzing) [Undibacter mobilis]RDV03137.1 asparagine synthase (glutamine-hydrolyzing) [Undibacter mobilis]